MHQQTPNGPNADLPLCSIENLNLEQLKLITQQTKQQKKSVSCFLSQLDDRFLIIHPIQFSSHV